MTLEVCSLTKFYGTTKAVDDLSFTMSEGEVVGFVGPNGSGKTTTMNIMADVVKAAMAAGIRDQVKIMLGGAPISEAFAEKIGADICTHDATSAAEAAVKFCQKRSRL